VLSRAALTALQANGANLPASPVLAFVLVGTQRAKRIDGMPHPTQQGTRSYSLER
jgi:hypothetical protein